MSKLLDQLRAALGDKYLIEREIGRGGMAVVFLAHERQFDRSVALKVLRPELAVAVGTDRFVREVEFAAALQHPNILNVIDAGEVDGIPYYTMPYIEGESLADRLEREQQLPIEDAIEITRDVADALGFAHGMGIVHRDIKPGNILLTGERAVVADFGIARAIDEAGTDKITSTGIALGTPAYMSPEQGDSDSALDGRSDIYSLGCVLYEMLTAEPPFTGPSAQVIIARHAAQNPASPRIVRHTVPPELEGILNTMLAKVPADRFKTAAVLRDALDGVKNATGPMPVSTDSKARWWYIPVIATVLAAVFGVWMVTGNGPALNDNRIVVFPLVSVDEAGEDVATVIGHALDGVGPLRWIDGWALLGNEEREDARNLSLAEAIEVSRDRLARFMVTGRVMARGDDSAEVFLELYDVHGDSSVARESATGPSSAPWIAGLRAVNQLLPNMIPTGGAVDEHWEELAPASVANFLLGESSYRRGQFESAFEYYSDAVDADSAFALAAVRGAQAASWNHMDEEVSELIRIALERQDEMDIRHSLFARGYQSYWAGDVAAAVSTFQQVIELYPEMAVAHWQLGETYFHLLPYSGQSDSLAGVALREAHRLDSTSANSTFHLLEMAIRGGDEVGIDVLRERFVAMRPDSALISKVDIMAGCVVGGTDAVDWELTVRQMPEVLLNAGKALAVAGTQRACAMRAFGALLSGDTLDNERSPTRQIYALAGAQFLLLIAGRAGEAEALLDSALAAGEDRAPALHFFSGVADPGEAMSRALEQAALDAERFGVDYSGTTSGMRLWILAHLEHLAGNSETVRMIADELDRRATANASASYRLRADAVEALAVLASGDSTEALRLYRSLIPGASPGVFSWSFDQSLAPDRIILSRLLLAAGENQEALDVASVFDSPAPMIYVLFLPPSLEIRLAAAEALGRTAIASAYRERIGRLEGDGF